MTLEEIPKDIMHANHHVSIGWSFKRKWRGPFKSFGGVRSFPVFPSPATEAPAVCQSSGGFTQDGPSEGMEGEGGRSVGSDQTSPGGAEQRADEDCGEVQWAEADGS